MNTFPLEMETRESINTRLKHLGWIIETEDPRCNVFQERVKTAKQRHVLQGKRPDYVLYQSNTDKPIAIIEAKRPGADLSMALRQAIDYANPLSIPLAFACNKTFAIAQHISQDSPLKIDGEEIQDFIDELTSLRFVDEGPEITSTPFGMNLTRSDLISTYKEANNILREDGLREGYERFSAFSEILFLKFIDESEALKQLIGERYCWSEFQNYPDHQLLDYIRDTVWKRLRDEFGDIFNNQFAIRTPSNLKSIVERISPINLTAIDSDIKGEAFEYFLKSVTNGNKDLGEYFTPRHIVRLMIRILKPRYGETIYDPFCGTGGFLLEGFKYLCSQTDTSHQEIDETLKQRTIFGRELTSTARIAKMNMILFGDGHNNIEQMDSLEHPVEEQHDVVLSNIPYSQETKAGNYYPIPTKNGDLVCIQHIWKSLKPGGRAGVVIPETFLYEGGKTKQVREFIVKQASELNIVSLPRGVFMPYTPEKTNILFFKKGDSQFRSCFFFAIQNDGFELNANRKPIAGSSDIIKCLSVWEDRGEIKGVSTLQNRELMGQNDWNLRPFFYMEDIPEIQGEGMYLSSSNLREIIERVHPNDYPDQEFAMLEISKNGVFLKEWLLGSKGTQKCKRVRAGDIVYNPHRVNIGSIGVIPNHFDGGLVSPAYVVIRLEDPLKYPPNYLVSVLKHPRYLKVIMNYTLGSTRASLPFNELIRIKIPKPSVNEAELLASAQKQLQDAVKLHKEAEQEIDQIAKGYIKYD
jgi:type I restriction enzyme M protein